VADLIDTLVARYNPVEDGQSLAGKLWYLADADHIIRIFKGLGLSTDPDFALAEQYLKTGEFKLGMARIYELEQKLAITLDSQFLLPIIRSFATPNLNILASDTAYNFQKCVNSTFPIAFARYQARLPDVMSRIGELVMNPVERSDLLIFLQCLQFIEPDGQLDTETLTKSMSPRSFILDQDVLNDDAPGLELFNQFYVQYKPTKDKVWNGIALCVPKKISGILPSILELYNLPKADPTMGDFLLTKEKYEWVTFDPNLNHDAIFDSILCGNLQKFRKMLSTLQRHLRETYKLDYEFSDLTSIADCEELIRLGRKFGGRGLEDYLDRLRMYCMAYAVTSAGSWRDKINHCGLHKRLSWGDVIQDPRDGARIIRRDVNGPIAIYDIKESDVTRNSVSYPRLPNTPPVRIYARWGM
jgi:hypothetical protein